MTSAPAQFLRTLPLFADLSVDEADELALTARPFHYKAGEHLFEQGELASMMYCLEHGRVLLSQRMSGEEKVALGQLGPGAVIGELALVDRDRRSASATALEPTIGYAISDLGFNVLRAACRPSAGKVIRRLATAISERLAVKTREQFGEVEATPEAESKARVAALRDHRSTTVRPPVEVFALLPAFANFEAAEIAALVRDAHVVELPRRHVIFAEGDPPSSCFVVLRGAVAATRTRADQREKLALLGPGRLFGELALFSPAPRSATCATRERTSLLEIEPLALDRLLAAESAVGFKFCDAAVRQLAGALRNADRRRVWRDVRERLS